MRQLLLLSAVGSGKVLAPFSWAPPLGPGLCGHQLSPTTGKAEPGNWGDKTPLGGACLGRAPLGPHLPVCKAQKFTLATGLSHPGPTHTAGIRAAEPQVLLASAELFLFIPVGLCMKNVPQFSKAVNFCQGLWVRRHQKLN